MKAARPALTPGLAAPGRLTYPWTVSAVLLGWLSRATCSLLCAEEPAETPPPAAAVAMGGPQGVFQPLLPGPPSLFPLCSPLSSSCTRSLFPFLSRGAFGWKRPAGSTPALETLLPYGPSVALRT